MRCHPIGSPLTTSLLFDSSAISADLFSRSNRCAMFGASAQVTNETDELCWALSVRALPTLSLPEFRTQVSCRKGCCESAPRATVVMWGLGFAGSHYWSLQRMVFATSVAACQRCVPSETTIHGVRCGLGRVRTKDCCRCGQTRGPLHFLQT